MAASTGLSDERRQEFDRNGYIVLPNVLSQDVVDGLLQTTNKLLDAFSLEDHPMTRFTTGENGVDHVGDDYFLTSGDKVRFFFEEDAITAQGQLLKPKNRAINKIGHYLHEEIPEFRAISLSPENRALAMSLGFQDPLLLQSMVICKQPEIGGRVPPHQDSTFLYTDPPSAVGFWYALEDARLDNGCLSFAKGSHKTAPVKQRFVRTKSGKGTAFEDNVGPKFPAGQAGPDTTVVPNESDEAYTTVPVSAGSLVLIHGNVLHKSERNTSSGSRFIYTFHLIEGNAHYDERNWLQPPPQGFSKL